MSAEFDKLRRTFARFEDFWVNGWSWRLARDPFIDATLAPNTSPQVYLLKTSRAYAMIGLPFTLTFAYHVTDTEIDLFAVRREDISSGV